MPFFAVVTPGPPPGYMAYYGTVGGEFATAEAARTYAVKLFGDWPDNPHWLDPIKIVEAADAEAAIKNVCPSCVRAGGEPHPLGSAKYIERETLARNAAWEHDHPRGGGTR